MAETDDAPKPGGGGSGMSGSMTLPVVGPVKKKVLFGVGGAAAAFVLWRYWQASQAGAAGEADADGDGFPDDGTIPPVAGQGGPIGDGSGQKEGPTGDDFGFRGTTNSQWSQYAVTQLSASDRWSYTDIMEALGQYLANRPLTATQQSIVQAAIAAAGQPPEGMHVIVPGGDVPVTVAPGGLTVTAKDTTTLAVAWTAVAGAASYRLYRSGVSDNVGTSADTKAEIGGLQPGKSYTISVAAVSASGKVGPKSAGKSATTKNITLKAPTGLKYRSATSTTVTATWTRDPAVDGYRLYRSGASGNVGASGDGHGTWYGLKKNTSYKIHVRALDDKGNLGPSSASITVKTKK